MSIEFILELYISKKPNCR